MRRYGRKKGESPSNTIIHVSELCRLCLAKDEEMLPIYEDEDVPLPLCIMACLNLEVYEEDGLPNMICRSCKYQLNKSYQFRKKCEAADVKLRRCAKLIHRLNGEDVKIELVDDNGEDSEEASSGGGKSRRAEGYSRREDGDPVELTEEELIGDYILVMSSDNMEMEEAISEASSDLTPSPAEERTAKARRKMRATRTKQEYESDEETDEVQRATAYANRKNVYKMERTSKNKEQRETQPLSQSIVGADEELELFRCDECPKAFTRRIMLKSHRSVHSTQRGFACETCERWFPARSALIRHELTHTGEKSFVCNICHRAFAQKEILLRHSTTHSGQKSFQCRDCDKSFTHREALRVHTRRHENFDSHDMQLYRCQLCTKTFCHAAALSMHLATHTGRTYKCADCEKCFTDESSMLRHSRVHSPKKIHSEGEELSPTRSVITVASSVASEDIVAGEYGRNCREEEKRGAQEAQPPRVSVHERLGSRVSRHPGERRVTMGQEDTRAQNCGAAARNSRDEEAEAKRSQRDTSAARGAIADSHESREEIRNSGVAGQVPDALSATEWRYELEERGRRKKNVMVKGFNAAGNESTIAREIKRIVRANVGVAVTVDKVIVTGGGIVVSLGTREMKSDIMKKRGEFKGSGIWIEDDLTAREQEVTSWLKKEAEKKRRAGRIVSEGYLKLCVDGVWWYWVEMEGRLERQATRRGSGASY